MASRESLSEEESKHARSAASVPNALEDRPPVLRLTEKLTAIYKVAGENDTRRRRGSLTSCQPFPPADLNESALEKPDTEGDAQMLAKPHPELKGSEDSDGSAILGDRDHRETQPEPAPG